jgi:hypothetical protein
MTMEQIYVKKAHGLNNLIIEDQAFSPSYDWLLPLPTPSPNQGARPARCRKAEKERHLPDRRES